MYDDVAALDGGVIVRTLVQLADAHRYAIGGVVGRVELRDEGFGGDGVGFGDGIGLAEVDEEFLRLDEGEEFDANACVIKE